MRGRSAKKNLVAILISGNKLQAFGRDRAVHGDVGTGGCCVIYFLFI
jgi:hypothetical protein